jgi:ABC-type branched-subunit amino acid transport system ATPase component
LALDISDRAFVVDDGRIVHTCSAADLDADTDLKHRLWLFDPGRFCF